MTPTATTSDADLVVACRAGDRDAFAVIVERYQRLLCSLAYSATGRVSESEDLAQEAFIEAWRQLGTLREPEKLRPWLCAIVRNRVGRLRRREEREPVCEAAPLDTADEPSATEEPVMDHLIREEEQGILWSELQRVPELYREPLILYYREHGSVEHVAAALDLSEDTVKQRLVRGRRILQERVLAFVEQALRRSTPGRVFTAGVLAALPDLATPTQAVVVGSAAVHGTTLVKSAGVLVWLTSLASVVNVVMQLRASLDQARTPRERRFVTVVSLSLFAGALLFIAAFWGLREATYRDWDHRVTYTLVVQGLSVVLLLLWPWVVGSVLRAGRRLRSAERVRHPELFLDPRDQVGSEQGSYRSKATLFGVPWVHYRFAGVDDGEKPVFAWIAGGDRAIGLLFAWGAWAVAPISVGGFAVGIFSVGAVGLGLVCLGTFAVGGFAVGTLAVGGKSYAWLNAVGWHTAQSAGFGVAGVAAEAPIAFAPHANDAVARQLLADPHAQQNHLIFLGLILFFSLVPLGFYAREVRRRLGPNRSVPTSSSEAPR